MGYFVNYKYVKRENRDEVLEGEIKVGSPYEDLPLSVLAGKIMALMARRNIDISLFSQISQNTLSGIFCKRPVACLDKKNNLCYTDHAFIAI